MMSWVLRVGTSNGGPWSFMGTDGAELVGTGYVYVNPDNTVGVDLWVVAGTGRFAGVVGGHLQTDPVSPPGQGSPPPCCPNANGGSGETVPHGAPYQLDQPTGISGELLYG